MEKTMFTVDKEKFEVRMERVFDAPRELVWQAYTDPALIPQWWGPSKYNTTVDKMDVVVDGVWRFVQKDNEGNQFAFNGVYKEIVKPEKLVYTFEFEDMPGHILTETITFIEENGKTKMLDIFHFASLEDLEGMVSSGMEDGATESMERLVKVLQQK